MRFQFRLMNLPWPETRSHQLLLTPELKLDHFLNWLDWIRIYLNFWFFYLDFLTYTFLWGSRNGKANQGRDFWLTTISPLSSFSYLPEKTTYKLARKDLFPFLRPNILQWTGKTDTHTNQTRHTITTSTVYLHYSTHRLFTSTRSTT